MVRGAWFAYTYAQLLAAERTRWIREVAQTHTLPCQVHAVQSRSKPLNPHGVGGPNGLVGGGSHGTVLAEEGLDVALLAELEGEERRVAVLPARHKTDHASDVGVATQPVDLTGAAKRWQREPAVRPRNREKDEQHGTV